MMVLELRQWFGRPALSAVAALAGPVAVAALVGSVEVGLLAASAGLALGGRVRNPMAPQIGATLGKLAAIVLSWPAALVLGRIGPAWGLGLGVTALVAVAALAGTFNRAVAVAALHFVPALLLAVNLDHSVALTPAALMVMGLGLGWQVLVLAWAEPKQITPSPPKVTLRTLWRRWRQAVGTRTFWRFPLRLIGGVAVAEAAVLPLALPHGQWTALNVALLTKRDHKAARRHAGQRVLGTMAAAPLAALLVLPLPAWALVVVVGGLAVVRQGNGGSGDLVSVAATTVLVLLLLSGGAGLAVETVLIRLLASVAGAVIVLLMLAVTTALLGRE